MGNLISLLQGVVDFPAKGGGIAFIGKAVVSLIKSIYSGGAVSYGVAVILFILILKLILLPLDFANKYFTKRNAAQMAKMKPETDALREQYPNDPMALNRATREVHKKHGYNMGGFCAVTVVNLVVTLCVFLSVFYSLQAIANHNVKLTAQELQSVYQTHKTANTIYLVNTEEEQIFTDQFITDINATYKKRTVGFLWIKNIWHSDTPWTTANLTEAEYIRHGEFASDLTSEDKKQQFNTIWSAVSPSQKRNWNGLLILIILAGVATWVSLYLNGKIMNTQNKDKQQKQKETKAQYSLRNVKNQADKPQNPQIDPAMMTKMMKFILPAIMVIFTMSTTAALAIYIISNSIFSTALTLGLNYPVDKLIKWQDKRAKNRPDTPPEADPAIINPHAKYFKNKRSK